MKNYQQILFPYAYNILGSTEDAKDAMQEVMYKYTHLGSKPDNEKNYLIKGVVNEAINIKRKKSRSQHQENWLPEPVATEKSDLVLELKELISYSMLFLLEKVNPKERAVFILKEAFSYTHPEIADVLGISVENSRKLLCRAHDKLKAVERRQPTMAKNQFETLERFVTVIRDKDLNALHQLLADDITFVADGGTKVQVVKKFCEGLSQVADLVVMVYHTFQSRYTIRPIMLNHQPALLYFHLDKLRACQVFEIGDDSKIHKIQVLIDPEKLRVLQY